ncbi:MAG: hypothetical protein SGI71_10140 [Verrucomicrobiota bacterium]|nr:hypothetical protein [Verrucomicrobiota bacterium]
MIKTQIQLPDELYRKAKAIAKQREWSLAEVVRRGIEYMTVAYPVAKETEAWQLPVLKADLFVSEFDKIDLKAIVRADELGMEQ